MDADPALTLLQPAHARVAEWIRHLDAVERRSPHTLRAYRVTLDGFVAFQAGHLGSAVDDAALAGLSLADFRAFLSRRRADGLSNASAARAVAALRSFFRWARRHRGIDCAAIGGLDVATFQDAGERYDVRVRLEEAQRDQLEDVSRLQVRSAAGALVELANVADLRVASGPSEIERENRGRRVTIYANTPGDVPLGVAMERFARILSEVGLPPGYVGEAEGMGERMQDTANAALLAFGLALLALYIVLASQFESFVQPVVIMLSAPLSFVGAFVALRVTGIPMSVFAQIGLIALMGLVMKNGILLVDYANQLRAEGASPRDAIARAGPMRLRPVLMTQFATIAGMIPVALASSDGAEFRNPMGVLVIGGLLSSTLLTLVVVPAFYTLAEDAIARLRSALAGLRAGRAGARLAGPVDSLVDSLPSNPEDEPT